MVFSRILMSVEGNARLARGTVAEEVATALREADGDVLIGGAGLAAEAIRLDLVDEFWMFRYRWSRVGASPPGRSWDRGSMTDFDVFRLREEAAARALARPVVPFAGTLEDAEISGGSVARAARWYRPAPTRDQELVVVFLHGGYGVIGDLSLQDGYCRRVASTLGVAVLATDYRLAPEHRIGDSAADAVSAARAAQASGARHVVLWGDSAGGAVALEAARAADASALVLSNPNVDLSLAGFDATAPGGPDASLSAWAFERWTGAPLANAPDFAAEVSGLPPLFAAVGSADSLLPDAVRLVRAYGEAELEAVLMVVAGASHGFMGGPDERTVGRVLRAARDFVDRLA